MGTTKILIQLALYACALLVCISCSSQDKEQGGCAPPAEGFSEADLIGTWKTGDQDRNDTLILRDDGLYKQIVYVEFENFDYESGWQSWRIENQDNGMPYLHLEGMRMCVYFSAKDCETSGSDDTQWYDFCRDEWVQTPGEGVLMVWGIPEKFIQPPRGINLVAFEGYTVGVTVYELQEP